MCIDSKAIMTSNVPRIFLLAGILFIFLFSPTSSIFSDWGEPCTFTDECIDHRFACLLDEKDGQMKCFCDQYHEWRGSHLGCYPKYNATTLIKKLVTIRENADARAEELDRIFVRGPLMAGLVVLVVTVGCATSVLIYCIHIRRRDEELKSLVKRMQTEIGSNKGKKKDCPTTSATV